LVSSKGYSTPRSKNQKDLIINSLHELRKPKIPKYKKPEEGLMFGVEAKKFFGFSDGMKEEAFR
jgi:hypothetical protein